MNWLCLSFAELTTNQLYELIKLRIDVFVVEQNCPYPELDDLDRLPEARHLMGYKDGKLLACLRILPPGSVYSQPCIGRVAIDNSQRGQGLAHTLIQEGMKQCLALWSEPGIKIGAQSYLEGFYQKHGFQTASEEYLEDGIPHIKMIYPAKAV
ncbi:GNAT family N-acetyltransferase [Parendozoicomonas haliclonae]|uniref:Protein ElaA n=1 Tax=Parendozoicomonas haliclonae TaxID=1960125 RepID=A0A1X7AEB3_9GAMM|nr:GNAT family N-acetyltransferase [Parendozoicomonas haliclonae]SMA32904.1 putative acyltransferase [Parendozoicomonas haliclonae]